MPAALKAVPPSRSPEREALRRAIEQHKTAEQRLAKIRDAQERAFDGRLNLSHAVTQAKGVLAEAESNESRYLAAVALNETDASGSPTKAGSERLAQLEHDYAQAKRTGEALDQEVDQAERQLERATSDLDSCVKVAAKADPAVQQLVGDYQAAQKAYLDACKLLAALGDLGINPLNQFGEGYAPLYNSVSQGPAPAAPAWQTAIERLKTDADAELPSP